MVNGVSSRELRVSDAEREHVVGLLQKAIGMGLLTLEEFTDRTDVALSSRTRAELNVVLADLPGMTHPEMRVRGGQWGRQPAGPPLPGEPMVLSSGCGSSITRNGYWQVPRSMLIRSKWGSGVNLDFTEAVFEHERLDMRIEVTGGAVTLRLPDGASVSLNDLNTRMGASVNDRVGFQGRQGTPQIVVSGDLSMAALTIKGPRR
ncbi:DUF1707 SHOCT-like domain-containing protein [Kutzneria kofuensis]|uniref:DUF1707 domain-containing protein n=1 Tax=Kutzneria kofuensis TaxID=103725 RepID=A0A7W9KIY3_9PSEU|nr:DUF1707 domain-containing protein [Kutzneria kofuensis]MBB5893400.1 hypothetical protein [Kutzneria kofuensis]